MGSSALCSLTTHCFINRSEGSTTAYLQFCPPPSFSCWRPIFTVSCSERSDVLMWTHKTEAMTSLRRPPLEHVIRKQEAQELRRVMESLIWESACTLQARRSACSPTVRIKLPHGGRPRKQRCLFDRV